MLTRTTRLIVVSSTIGLAAAIAHGQTLVSANAARELRQRLDAIGVTAIAAKDPRQSGVFVAALYVPASQLLVVRARHPSADAVAYRIDAKQFRDVYLDLQATPTPQEKFFVQDSGADGILDTRPGSGDIDVLYEDGVRQIVFNGSPRAQHVSDAEYKAKRSAADAEYARLLGLLTGAVRASLESSRTVWTPHAWEPAKGSSLSRLQQRQHTRLRAWRRGLQARSPA